MTAPRLPPDAPLPPQVWRGRELAQAQERTLASGHAALDAQLPGGGWPLGCLVEVLQQEASRHVWQLAGPALAQAMAAGGDPAVLVQPPYQPFGPSLRGQGIVPERLLCVQAGTPALRLWAAEQALRCADVCAVLAWLPQARAEDLHRLHLVAQSGTKLLLVFRGLAARQQASPARLRLLVQGGEALEVQVLKRRGPPLLQPLVLRSQPDPLAALLAARKARRAGVPPVSPTPASHGLDRAASLAP
ncbi:MAG: translesion DNA synthesis-associated protein ImuA [Burkholderiales bacterium]|nr:translesion DNA synthesis-associated protein ImuA [Burkholderiales bacterium]